MINKIKNIFKYIGFLISINWFITAVLVIFSIYFGSSNWIINTVIGSIFFCISFLFFMKNKYFVEVLNSKDFKKFINVEKIFLVLNLLISIIVLSAVISRLKECYTIFG